MSHTQPPTMGRLIILLGPLITAFAFALDIYVPILPRMMRLFHTTQASIQLTLSLFMLIFSLGQLIAGPLSDQFGRKPTALISTALFTIGSLLCVYATNLTSLLIFRVIEGAGACGCMVVALSVARDCFDGEAAGRLLSYLNSAISLSPIFAPIIGGYLAAALGWQANFLFLTLIGTLAFIGLACFLKESHPTHKRIKIDHNIFTRYWEIISHRASMAYLLSSTAAICTLFSFFSVSSFLFIDELHVAVTHFGYYFAYFGIGFFIGSMINAKVLHNIGIRRSAIIGSSIMICGGLLLILIYHFIGDNKIGIMAPVLIMSFGGAWMVGASSSGMLEPFKHIAGSASAILGCSQFLIASVVAYIVVHSGTTTPVPLGLAAIIVPSAALLLLLTWTPSKLTGNSQKNKPTQ